MIVRTLAECEKTDRKVHSQTGTWDSTRMLLKDDKVGFSFHITTIYAGSETHIHYQNHFESVYCISGNGEIETIAEARFTRSSRARCTCWTSMTSTCCAVAAKT